MLAERYCSAWLGPQELVKAQYEEYYERYPVGARLAAVASACLLGMVEPVLFPVKAAVGVIALPLIGVIGKATGCLNNEQAAACGLAGAFSFSCAVGAIAAAVLFVFIAYYLPIAICGMIFLGITIISVSIHVHKAVRSPPQDPSLNVAM